MKVSNEVPIMHPIIFQGSVHRSVGVWHDSCVWHGYDFILSILHNLLPTLVKAFIWPKGGSCNHHLSYEIISRDVLFDGMFRLAVVVCQHIHYLSTFLILTIRTYPMGGSTRRLRRERVMLYRQMQKRFSAEERESLYGKWGIALDSKQRKWQLVRRLWTETGDLEHVRESSSIVAKLIGLLEPGLALKEMFGLSIAPEQYGNSRRSFKWKHGVSSLNWSKQKRWLRLTTSTVSWFVVVLVIPCFSWLNLL